MGQIVILGSANAVPDEEHSNTHLAILQGKHVVLVDATGDPISRLQKAGIDPASLTGVIATHFHPDHVSSIPLLLMDLWLMGRRHPIPVYGLAHTIDRLEKMVNLYELQEWPNFYPIEYHRIPEEEMAPIILDVDLRIYSSPVKHLLPTMGMRVEFVPQGKIAAYSCDTEPCPQVINLASEADVLLHEATGSSVGHTSAAQAGWVAQQAKACSLYLIHYHPPSRGGKLDDLITEARQAFSGPVFITHDLMKLDFD